MRISNFLIYILSAIFGFGVCLIIFNLQNTSKCEKGSPNVLNLLTHLLTYSFTYLHTFIAQELEKYSEILEKKLKLTEKQLKKNNLQLNALLRDLQHRLLKLDVSEVDVRFFLLTYSLTQSLTRLYF